MAGAESDPSVASSGQTVSSFAVLDQIIESLVHDTKAYPNLQQVVIAGHSSGGQIVQRHALFTRLPVRCRCVFSQSVCLGDGSGIDSEVGVCTGNCRTVLSEWEGN